MTGPTASGAQAAGFDAIGTHYDEVFPHKDGQVRMVEQLLERLPASARALDLGCGTRMPTARQLIDGGCEVIGVDISRVILDQARLTVPEATFLQHDIIDTDVTGSRFDAAVAFSRCSCCLETASLTWSAACTT
jgi:trans-aconitate methyltransferase